ncbi:PAS domain S-box protein (plasmid) [Halorubrum sp. BOL3-1]|uniref:PAS domain S-box protein n=1 Tax=Halorubrum sp. BOL3-1 TaxID=2497325 RepID=UPI001004ED90|nr:PAS domain S-box protein [Halorubrum sp. BOL3-1]QAU14528.1 PAS domain S-box protein [Halorubrum sp. BOL3-1]
MSEKATDLFGDPSRTAPRVFPVISDKENRKQLSDWIDSHESLEYVPFEDDLEAIDFDVCILDKKALREYREELARIKTKAEPVIVPYLLLVPEYDVSLIEFEQEQLIDAVTPASVDEIASLPLKQKEVEWRVRALLRLRNQSVQTNAKARRYQSFFESIRDAFLVTDTDRNIVDCNPAFTDLFGYSLDEIAGKPTHSVYESKAEFEEMGEAIQGNIGDREFTNMVSYETKSGEVFPGETNIFYLHDQDGEIQGFVGLIRDVSERLERERELERYEAAVEGSTDMLVAADRDRRVLIANDRFRELVGQTNDEIRGSHLRDVVGEDDFEDIEPRFERTLDGEQVNYIWDTTIDENKTRFLDVRTYPLRDGEDDEITVVVASLRDITEEKERQERLSVYERAIKGADELMAAIDDECQYLFANEAYRRVHGLDSEEYTQLTLREGVGEEAFKTARPYVERAFEGETVTYRMTRSPEVGAERTLSIQYSPLQDESGSTWGVVTTMRDITDRKERERELRRVNQAVEASVHAIFITDPDGTITYANPAFEEMTGFSPEEARGDTPAILDSGEMSDAYFEEFWETILSGETWEAEVINRHKNGETYTANQTVAPVTGNGDIEAFVAVQTDITERKQREQRLQRQSRAIANAPVGITISDPDQEDNPLIYVNDAFVEMTGYLREEILGENCRFLQGKNTDSERVARIREAIDNEEPIAIELRNYRKDGTEFWNHLEIAPVRNDEGEVINYVGFQQDVTERRQHHQQLETIDRMLRHNLRNDMNVIQGHAELIHSETSGDVAQSAAKIGDVSYGLMETAEKEREITEILLEDPIQEEITIKPVLQRVASTVKSDHSEATITVECPEDVTVRATTQFEEALLELVENGIIHDDSDSPDVAITVTRSDEKTYIDIADTGPPIPEIEQNVLDEKAEQTPVYHGTGLGLWLVKLITTRSGGTITVNENTPTGNIVRITFQQ